MDLLKSLRKNSHTPPSGNLTCSRSKRSSKIWCSASNNLKQRPNKIHRPHAILDFLVDFLLLIFETLETWKKNNRQSYQTGMWFAKGQANHLCMLCQCPGVLFSYQIVPVPTNHVSTSICLQWLGRLLIISCSHFPSFPLVRGVDLYDSKHAENLKKTA